MPVLAGANIKHAFGDRIILDGCTLSLEPGERVGIVGRNGCGKTTLLKVLAGRLNADSGELSMRRGLRRAYLEQDPSFPEATTLRDAAESAFADLHALHHRLDGVFERMRNAAGDALERLLREQADLEHRMEAAGGYAIGHKIEAILHGVGFSDAQFETPVSGLSGGQRARLALARLLLENPDVALLDEPTNHLDIEGREWLERFLAEEFKGAVLMISHDRYLLDRVVHRIVEVEQGRLVDYPGNYSKFRELRAQRRLTMARAFAKEQDQFRREEAYIRKYKAGQRAKQARGRETRLTRAKSQSNLERPIELDTFTLELPQADRTGDLVFTVRDLAKRYPRTDGSTLTLFEHLTLNITRGDRWGILGPNGTGKTTLIRCLLKQVEPDEGTIQPGSRLAIGVFAQSDAELDRDATVVQHLQRYISKEAGLIYTEQQARDLAGAFLFSGDEQDKPLGVMSGGGGSRARLAALMASAKNVLVLDEPTNHLDIPSAERLEAALAADGPFEGTVILISHDRALIDACCEHLIIFDGQGGVRVFHGSYSEWVQMRDRPPPRAGPTAARSVNAPPPPRATSPRAELAKGKSRYSWMPIEQIESHMQKVQGELARFDAAMAEPSFWTDAVKAAAISAQREETAAQLAELEEEWLKRHE